MRLAVNRERWKNFVEAPNAVRHHGEEKEEEENYETTVPLNITPKRDF
jgi:hypothetical protein